MKKEKRVHIKYARYSGILDLNAPSISRARETLLFFGRKKGDGLPLGWNEKLLLRLKIPKKYKAYGIYSMMMLCC
jgi:hypothetical protein